MPPFGPYGERVAVPVRQIRQRGTVPQRQRLVQQTGGAGRVTGTQRGDPSAVSRSKRNRSTASASAASAYPPGDEVTAAPPSARRKRPTRA